MIRVRVTGKQRQFNTLSVQRNLAAAKRVQKTESATATKATEVHHICNPHAFTKITRVIEVSIVSYRHAYCNRHSTREVDFYSLTS